MPLEPPSVWIQVRIGYTRLYIDRSVCSRVRLKFVDPRQRGIDDHAQFRLIRTLRPGTALLVESANGEPILAIAFRPVIERFNVGLRLADLLPTCAAIL